MSKHARTLSVTSAFGMIATGFAAAFFFGAGTAGTALADGGTGTPDPNSPWTVVTEDSNSPWTVTPDSNSPWTVVAVNENSPWT